eukprot:gene9273-12493_t
MSNLDEESFWLGLLHDLGSNTITQSIVNELSSDSNIVTAQFNEIDVGASLDIPNNAKEINLDSYFFFSENDQYLDTSNDNLIDNYDDYPIRVNNFNCKPQISKVASTSFVVDECATENKIGNNIDTNVSPESILLPTQTTYNRSSEIDLWTDVDIRNSNGSNGSYQYKEFLFINEEIRNNNFNQDNIKEEIIPNDDELINKSTKEILNQNKIVNNNPTLSPPTQLKSSSYRSTNMKTVSVSEFASSSFIKASEALFLLKDAPIAKISSFLQSNFYYSSVVGFVSESLFLFVDRARSAADTYIHKLTSDDPEKIHLSRIKNSSNWDHIILRYTMASLTWKQRQLIAETKDEADSKNSLSKIERLPAQTGTVGPVKLLLNSDTKNELVPNISTSVVKASSNIDNRREISFISEEEVGKDNSRAYDYMLSNMHEWILAEAQDKDNDDIQYELAKYFEPPPFAEKSYCSACSRSFGVSLFRHHCRYCGESFCDEHSLDRRCIFRFGMVSKVRVCTKCRYNIDEVHRRDQLIWKSFRVRSYLENRLIDYFNPSVDRGVDKVFRIADCSLLVVKNTITLNFPTKVLLETVTVLQRYGLSGFAGLLLRKDFMESVETLKRISGMDTMFRFSLHELTACIYYKLAIERGLRGCNPDGERIAHKRTHNTSHLLTFTKSESTDRSNRYKSSSSTTTGQTSNSSDSNNYECRDASDADLNEAIRFSPIALKIIYELDPMDAQRLAKSQGWSLIFTNTEAELGPEQPGYSLFATDLSPPSNHWRYSSNSHKKDATTNLIAINSKNNANESKTNNHMIRKEAVLAIRGTQTIQDVVTDIRAAPQHFPPDFEVIKAALRGEENSTQNGTFSFSAFEENGDGDSPSQKQWDWLSISKDSSYACGGMARSALYVLREVGPSLLQLHNEGYSIILVGHSLGGAVAALLTFMLLDIIGGVRCVTYGCPSCVDASTSDLLKSHVINIVLHDDVISRITPHSIRLLMKELNFFRNEMPKLMKQDWEAIIARAASLWSPKWRNSHSNSMGMDMNMDMNNDNQSNNINDNSFESNPNNNCSASSDEDSDIALVEDEELPDLWLPGRIIHMYCNRGQILAAEVTKNFPDLRKIEIQGNIFEDHRSMNIMNALFEVRAVRASIREARGAPPEWMPYNKRKTCCCCNNSFTWHTTFTGDAQEYRERYNCRFCGLIVCGPCSSHKQAIPSLGLIFPRRICDNCFFKGDFAHN